MLSHRTRPREEWRSLLGAHHWNEILISPTEHEKDKVSRVYFCMYNTGRQVQKNGRSRSRFVTSSKVKPIFRLETDLR